MYIVCMNSNVHIIMQSLHYTYSSQKSHREHTLTTGYHSYLLNMGLDEVILAENVPRLEKRLLQANPPQSFH